MSKQPQALQITLGQYSTAGVKPENQDFHGAIVPTGASLHLKGVAIALADGISSSAVGAEAAQTAVGSFLSDYYATPDSWSVRQSATRVINAANGWLHGRNISSLNPDKNAGLVCTFDALVLKGREAHIFHAGDARVYAVHSGSAEQLTEDHRIPAEDGGSYLARGLGIQRKLDIDYRSVPLSVGDIFTLSTDGLHDFIRPDRIAGIIAAADTLDAAAKEAVTQALAAGSDDNLTLQIVRVEHLPDASSSEALLEVQSLPAAPQLSAGDTLDGFRIIRQLHASSRSQVLLACDGQDRQVILKVPSTELRGNAQHINSFLLEEWVASRLRSDHLMQAAPRSTPATALYVAMSYVEGQTLRAWMADNPTPDLTAFRSIIGQIIAGLRAMHRKQMLHQDLRPENIMIDREGTVKIIDFGAVHIPGVAEAAPGVADFIPGTFQYTAPEYLSGDMVSWRSDQFALGVIAYELLTGHLPYGTAVAKVSSPTDQRRLTYTHARTYAKDIPLWLDAALRKAVQPDPVQRYDALSEFLADISAGKPNIAGSRRYVPLVERNPTAFWQSVAAFFALSTAILAYLHFSA
ncbi:MAG: bifunctional protein-serine/threonine kinase/phosphatase [Pseudomonadota bacterium]